MEDFNNDPIDVLHKGLIANGYKLPDINTFKSDMQDLSKRQRLYSTLQSQKAYNKTFDDFNNQYFSTDVKKKESTTPSVSNVSSNVATQPIQPTETIQKPNYSWSKEPTIALQSGNYRFNFTETNSANARAQKQKLEETAKKETNQEAFSRVNKWNQGKAKLFNQADNTLVDEQDSDFIFGEFPNITQENANLLAQHLYDMADKNPNRYANIMSRRGNTAMTEKEKLSLMQEALVNKLEKSRNDIDILEARAKTGAKEVDVNTAQRTLDDYNKTFQEVKNVVKQFPEEYERLKRVKANNEAVTWKDTDSGLTKTYKTTISTLGALQNTAIDAGVSFLKWANGMADQMAGQGDKYTFADKGIDAIADYLDSWKIGEATEYQDKEDLLGKNRGLTGETFVPKLAGQLGNMALLFYGGGGNATRLAVSGAATTYGQYYNEAKVKVGDENTAQRYGLYMSAIQGMLENVNPNFGVMSFGKQGFKEGLEFLAKNPKATLGQFFKEVGKNALGENAQELTQMVAEKAGNMATNAILGKDAFDTTISQEELTETAVLTTSVSVLAGGLGKGHYDAQHKAFVEMLQKADPENIANTINELIKEGKITGKQGEVINKLADKKQFAEEIEIAKEFGVNLEQSKEQKTEVPEDKKVKEITEDELIQEEKPKEAVKSEEQAQEPNIEKKQPIIENKQVDESANKSIEPINEIEQPQQEIIGGSITPIAKPTKSDAQQGEKEAKVKKTKSNTSVRKGVFGNMTALEKFEPQSLEEELMLKIAKGEKINESDFGKHLKKDSPEYKKWKQFGSIDESNNKANAIDVNYTDNYDNANKALGDIILGHSSRHSVANELKRRMAERSNMSSKEELQGLYEAEQENTKDIIDAADKNEVEISEQDIEEYNNFAYNLNDIEEQAKADKELGQKYDAAVNKVLNDPQYQNEDGSFNYEKLLDNAENGFEPDIFELWNAAEKLGLDNEEGIKSVKQAINDRPTQRTEKIVNNETVTPKAEENGKRDREAERSEGERKGLNESRLDEQIAVKQKEVAKLTEHLGERSKERESLKRKSARSLSKENQKDIFEQEKPTTALFDEPLSTGTKDKNIFTDFDNETKGVEVALQKAQKELSILENSRESVIESDKAQTAIDFEKTKNEKSNGKSNITSPLPTKEQSEIDLLNKRIAKETNPDKKKILEKKKAELERKQKLAQALKNDTPTELDDANLSESMNDKEQYELTQKEILDAEIKKAEKEFDKASKDILFSANPVNPRLLEAGVKLGYLKFKRFLYETGKRMSLSDMANAFDVPISDRLRDIYNMVTSIFNSENSPEFRDKLSFTQWVRKKIQDQNVAVKLLYEDMRRAGVEINDQTDFAKIQELSTSRIAYAQNQIKEWFRGKDKTELRGVKESEEKSWVGRVKKDIGSYETQMNFMYARHALDFNARAREILDKRKEEEIAVIDEKLNTLQEEYAKDPAKDKLEKINKLTQEKNDLLNEPYPDKPSGMSDVEANDIISEAQKDPDKYAKMIAFSDEFRKEVVTKRIDLMEESGLISSETADNMRTGKREGYVTEMPNYLPLKVKSENFEETAKPLTQGKLGAKIFGIQVTNKYGKEQRYDPVVMAMTELQATQQAAETNKALVGLYEAIKQTPFGQNIKIVNSRGTYAANETGQLVETRPGQAAQVHDLLREHAIPFRVDGKIKYIFFNPIKDTNGRFVPHPVIEAIKKSPESTSSYANAYLNAYRAVVNYLRLIRTSLNLGFAIDNPFRDLGEALTNISDIGKDQMQTEKIRLGILKNMPKSFAFFFNPSKAEPIFIKEMSDNFEEMRQQGVMMSWKNYEGVDTVVNNFEKDIERIEQGKGATGKELAIKGFKALTILSDSTENMTRLAVYSSMKQNGYSAQEAAYVAKNITLNFEKKGDVTKWTNLAFMFSNAGIQGASRMISAAKSKNFWIFGAAMTTFAALNRAALLNGMDDDEEDKWIYNDLENKGRTMIYNPFDPKNPIRLPKPYSAMRIFLNLGESITDVAKGKRTAIDAADKNIKETLTGAIDPIGGSGSSGTNYVPTEFLKTYVQVALNTSWSGSPILKGEGYMDKQEIKPYMRSNVTTKPFFDKAALSIKDKTGFEIQPTTLEYIWKGYGENAVKSISDYGKIGSVIYDAATGKEINQSEVPVLKRFYYEADEKKGQVLYGILDILENPKQTTNEQIRYIESQLPKIMNDGSVSSYIKRMINDKLPKAKNKKLIDEQEEQQRKKFEENIEAKERGEKPSPIKK